MRREAITFGDKIIIFSNLSLEIIRTELCSLSWLSFIINIQSDAQQISHSPIWTFLATVMKMWGIRNNWAT